MTTTETRPEIVVLCGSTRFYDEFQQANYHLTMSGKIVLSVGFYPHAKARHGHGEGVGHDSTEKIALDELHKRKIDLADRVLVLNVGGYIGDSTRSEIAYATEHGKPIDWLEPLNAPEPPEPEKLTASDFEMRWDAEHTFPFTESEDAVIIAYGHPDPIALAAQITEYDRLCAGPYTTDGWETDPGDIRQTHAVLAEGKPGEEWHIRWGKDADTAGAFPVSLVVR